MNKLAVADNGHYRLPRHAHIVVYERSEGEHLLTIYDCGAAQKPPSAQLIGHLVRVGADHELVEQPNGYIVKLRQRAILEDQPDSHWVIRAMDDTQYQQ
jgi:hypothetical protein